MDRIDALLKSNPYLSHLGIEFEINDGMVLGRVPFKQDLVGNPMIPAIHGGVIAASMELVAVGQLMLEAALEKRPKTVNVSIDYLRSGKPQILFAKAHIFKLGRRVANVEAFAFQEDETKPIAKLHGNFLLA